MIGGGWLGPAIERRQREAEMLKRTSKQVDQLMADLEEKLPGTFKRRAD